MEEKLRNRRSLQARLDIVNKRKEVLKRSYISNNSGETIRISIKDDTEVLPVVNNILVGNKINPNNNELERIIDLYTAKRINNHWTLELITTLIHGSELFIGETEYGYNVFALAKDLTEEEYNKYQDRIIRLIDLDYYFDQYGLYGKANNNIKL